MRTIIIIINKDDEESEQVLIFIKKWLNNQHWIAARQKLRRERLTLGLYTMSVLLDTKQQIKQLWTDEQVTWKIKP